jgi:outer membrane protein assembly factor BamB
MIKKLSAFVVCFGLAAAVVGANNWPEWRGAARDGASSETGLPSKWSPAGEGVLWKLPFGGRSTPVIFGNRLYLLTTTPASTAAEMATTQERLVAVNADTGAILWEKKFPQYLSDVPQHRAGWSSPAVDPATGNIYVLTVSAEFIAVAPDGKILWTRSMPEEYGAITTHGGRTASPLVDGDKVIFNVFLMGWGDLARPGNRFFAFNKATGQTMWVSSPQSKHYDTNHAPPIIADVNGSHLLIAGGTDGVYHALQANTGKPVWNLEVSKRAILNGPLFRDNTVFVTHGEENIDRTEMGMVAALDVTNPALAGPQPVTGLKWNTHGFLPTFASPVLDGDRLYSVDNSAIVGAFDVKTGKELWTKTLGTLQKGSPVFADGKLYVGTENGKFFILKPSATGVEILDEDALVGKDGSPDPVIASPAVANGRVYVTSMEHLYAVGTRKPAPAREMPPPPPPVSTAPVAQVQVFPYEALLDPGATATFTLKLFDAKGNFIRSEPAASATWALDTLQGTVTPAGVYTAPASGSAGLIKATVGGVTGQARVRVIPPLPWSYDFNADKTSMPWWNANLKGTIGQVDAQGVLVRPRDDTVGRRAKIILGRPEWSNYTMEADVRGVEMRRQRGDAGLINQRYVMVLFGNTQKLELHPWQAADEMTVRVPFTWDKDKWYHMKLRVENRPDGTTRVQGKVWETGQPEPAAWTIEKLDRIPHRNGAPGLYGDGISDVFFDNLKVYRNQ